MRVKAHLELIDAVGNDGPMEDVSSHHKGTKGRAGEGRRACVIGLIGPIAACVKMSTSGKLTAAVGHFTDSLRTCSLGVAGGRLFLGSGDGRFWQIRGRSKADPWQTQGISRTTCEKQAASTITCLLESDLW